MPSYKPSKTHRTETSSRKLDSAAAEPRMASATQYSGFNHVQCPEHLTLALLLLSPPPLLLLFLLLLLLPLSCCCWCLARPLMPYENI